jgi:nucleoside triphosphate pyrophosphatase
MNLPPVILASVSPRRAELLRTLGVKFEVIPSDATEVHHEHLTATEICQLNAYRKARVVAKKFPDALVIGADTLVYLDETFYGKPATLAEARRMLGQLQGRAHQVVTGVCLIHLRAHRQKIFAESTEVKFLARSPKQINHYLSLINPLDKAGAYAIQEFGHLLVDHVSGSISNVVGLPLERLRDELKLWENKVA